MEEKTVIPIWTNVEEVFKDQRGINQQTDGKEQSTYLLVFDLIDCWRCYDHTI